MDAESVERRAHALRLTHSRHAERHTHSVPRSVPRPSEPTGEQKCLERMENICLTAK
jgi:hypothetical protein